MHSHDSHFRLEAKKRALNALVMELSEGTDAVDLEGEVMAQRTSQTLALES